jgi:hypothetical protein
MKHQPSPSRIICILFLFCYFFPLLSKDLPQQAKTTLEKSIHYFHSINIHGGYVYNYTLDMSEKWGEGRTDDHTIEVQPPGTPTVGLSFLRAFRVTKNEKYLNATRDAAYALIRGQNDLGGWGHKIYFNGNKSRHVSFDDDQTQTAIEFLMELDQDINDDSLTIALEKALTMMTVAQLKNGGWPHQYPEQGSYHDYATFNDEGINDCIRIMIKAYENYGKEEYYQSIRKVGRFLMMSQLPPPQPGWAQQYNEYLQPAWARAFEPPAVCPQVTINVLNDLMNLYEFLGRSQYLEPIPDAFRWLDDIRLPNGKWARFVELGTNKSLYYDRGRIRVDSTEELSIERRTGYGYESNLSPVLEATRARFKNILKNIKEKTPPSELAPSQTEIKNRLNVLGPMVKKIIQDMDDVGRWITKNDQYKKIVPGVRWSGEYAKNDRISSAVFNRNVNTLCEYLELIKLER